MGIDAETQDINRFVQATCRDLDTIYDREAVSLICEVGIFAVQDPGRLATAVERLMGPRKADGAFEALAASGLTAKQRKLLDALEQSVYDESVETTDTAYFLGVAVGRRIGGGALKPVETAVRSGKASTTKKDTSRRMYGVGEAA